MTTEQLAIEAELLKEVGEPIALVSDAGIWADAKGDYASVVLSKEKLDSGRPYLYSADQVAAAILKAEQRVTEACVDLIKSLDDGEAPEYAAESNGQL